MSTQQLRRPPRSDVTSNPIPPGGAHLGGRERDRSDGSTGADRGGSSWPTGRSIRPGASSASINSGVWGGFMSLAFLALSVSACFLVAALHSQVATLRAGSGSAYSP